MSLEVFVTSKGDTGKTLSYSLCKVTAGGADGNFFDFSASTFKAFGSIPGTNWRGTLTERTNPGVGSWTGGITSTPVAQFADGKYRMTVHDNADSNKSLAAVELFFHVGDEVELDAQILTTVGYDVDATVHEKIDGPAVGGYTGDVGSNIKADLAATANNALIISVVTMSVNFILKKRPE